jgi:hypothetical protein
LKKKKKKNLDKNGSPRSSMTTTTMMTSRVLANFGRTRYMRTPHPGYRQGRRIIS